MPSARASRWHPLGDGLSTVAVDWCRALPLPDLLPSFPWVSPQTDRIPGRSGLDSTSRVMDLRAMHQTRSPLPRSHYQDQPESEMAWSELDNRLNPLSTTPQISRVLPGSGPGTGCRFCLLLVDQDDLRQGLGDAGRGGSRVGMGQVKMEAGRLVCNEKVLR